MVEHRDEIFSVCLTLEGRALIPAKEDLSLTGVGVPTLMEACTWVDPADLLARTPSGERNAIFAHACRKQRSTPRILQGNP